MILAAMLLQAAMPISSASMPIPTVPLASLVTVDDYPLAALRYGQSGTVRFRLDVGPDGRVQGCTVLTSSGSSVLDSGTCRLMQSRARFDPARNVSGKATVGQFVSAIAWKLGPAASPRLDAMTALWTACVNGEAAKRAVSRQQPTAVSAAAFDACRTLEPLLLAELASAELPGLVPTASFARLKEQTATRLAEQLRTIRAILQVEAPPR